MTIYRLKDDGALRLGEDPRPAGDPLESDPSWTEGAPSLANTVDLDRETFRRRFLTEHALDYIADYFAKPGTGCRVVTHPSETVTCYEKAQLLGDFSPLRVVKTLYFEHPDTAGLWGIVVPETGCFLDRASIQKLLDTIEKPRVATRLPAGMSVGTCSPFVTDQHLSHDAGVRVERLVFDSETLVMKRHERSIDDFSFVEDKRLSLQMNYFDCFDMLRQRHPELVVDREVLTTSFKETFVRRKGRLTITYDIASISYRMASVMHAMHADGDVSVTNDYVDELDLPEFPAFRRRPPQD